MCIYIDMYIYIYIYRSIAILAQAILAQEQFGLKRFACGPYPCGRFSPLSLPKLSYGLGHCQLCMSQPGHMTSGYLPGLQRSCHSCRDAIKEQWNPDTTAVCVQCGTDRFTGRVTPGFDEAQNRIRQHAAEYKRSKARASSSASLRLFPLLLRLRAGQSARPSAAFGGSAFERW